MKVVTNIYLYGEGATTGRANMAQSELSILYNNGGDYFTTSDAGKVYDVVFEFSSLVLLILPM